MREGWRRVALGEVLEQVKRPVAVAELQVVPFAGVRWYAGGVYHRVTEDAATVKTRSLNRLVAGDIVYNRMWATKSSFGRVGDDAAGCLVTNDFPVFRSDARHLLGEFIELLFHMPAFQRAAADAASGTTERRRLKERDFLRLKIDLPPLREQRRVVDLVSWVRDAAAACRSAIESSERALQTIRREAFDYGVYVELGELLDRIEAGRSPVALDRPPTTAERGVLKVSAVRASGFDPAESKAVADSVELPPASRLASGDLLMTRANTAQLVGMACVVEDAPTNLFLCDKTLRLVPIADQDSQALCELLLSPQVRDQLLLAGTGTSGSMKNISQAKIRALRVPNMSGDAQAELRDVTRGLRGLVSAQHGELAALEALEGQLLADLLSGNHEIPESYDALLSEVA